MGSQHLVTVSNTIKNPKTKSVERMNRRTEFELVRILSRSSPLNGADIPELCHYVTEHEAWVDSQFLLCNDLVTLHGVDDNQAWFCVTPASPYSASPHEFVFLNQFTQATHLVLMTHHSLHRIAEEVGLPS